MADNPSLVDNFVKALRYYIAVSGKTKKEIADGIKIPPTTFSSWSNGKHLPDMEKLQSLADYLGAPIDNFFNFSTTVINPDPLLEEMDEIFPKLSTENKILVRDVALRILQLQEK